MMIRRFAYATDHNRLRGQSEMTMCLKMPEPTPRLFLALLARNRAGFLSDVVVLRVAGPTERDSNVFYYFYMRRRGGFNL